MNTAVQFIFTGIRIIGCFALTHLSRKGVLQSGFIYYFKILNLDYDEPQPQYACSQPTRLRQGNSRLNPSPTIKPVNSVTTVNRRWNLTNNYPVMRHCRSCAILTTNIDAWLSAQH